MKSTHVIFKKLPGWIDLYLSLGSHIYQAWNHCRFSTQEALGEKQKFKAAVFHNSSSPFLSQTSFSENLEVYHACFSANDLPGRVTEMLAQINKQRGRKENSGWFQKIKETSRKNIRWWRFKRNLGGFPRPHFYLDNFCRNAAKIPSFHLNHPGN